MDSLLAFLAGALTTLNPCVLPILPLVLAAANTGIDVRNLLATRLAPLFMGAGMVSSFALLGLVIGLLGERFHLDGSTTRLFAGVLLVLFGLIQLIPTWSERFTRLATPLSNWADGLSRSAQNGQGAGSTFLAAFLMGALLGAIWSPCSGPLLGATLTLVSQVDSALKGTWLLACFGAGAASVLVLVGYISRTRFLGFRDLVLRHSSRIKQTTGCLLVFIGLAIVSGLDKRLEALLVNLMPDWLAALTTQI